MIPPQKWMCMVPSQNAYKDEKGYTREPKIEYDKSTWSGWAMEKIQRGVEKIAENQRNMGYKVYENDPGKSPSEMSHYEQCLASKDFWNELFK